MAAFCFILGLFIPNKKWPRIIPWATTGYLPAYILILFSAAWTVFSNSIAMVIGPTPPGTGV